MYQVFRQDHFIPGPTITQIRDVPGYFACVGMSHTARSSPAARCERRRRKQPHLYLNGSGWRQNSVGEVLAGGLFPEIFLSNTSGVKILRVPRRGRASEPRNEGRRPEVTPALTLISHSCFFPNLRRKSCASPKGRASGPKMRGPKARVSMGPAWVRRQKEPA